MLPAEEQPLPAAVSPTAESPGYITESEPEMEPEENDGDDEKSKGDSIDYPTSENDADDDGDNLLEDDADDEDEEESSDSEEEEEEHLAQTVPAPAQYSSVSEFDETEPFEEGETAATPPPFGRIYVQGYLFNPIYLCHSVRSQSESIPEADIPLQKRARFTTPTSRYEIGKSSVATAARYIRPTLTIAESRRADDYCQSREVHTSTLVMQMQALRREVSTLQRQNIEHAQRDVAPEDG
nr:hypothetical protein [Tanacetum cinerariifolium]